MAGKMRYEQTNRRVKTNKAIKYWNKKSSYHGGWITLMNKYPSKCSVCNKYIGHGVMILWHKTDKLIMHKSNCLDTV